MRRFGIGWVVIGVVALTLAVGIVLLAPLSPPVSVLSGQKPVETNLVHLGATTSLWQRYDLDPTSESRIRRAVERELGKGSQKSKDAATVFGTDARGLVVHRPYAGSFYVDAYYHDLPPFELFRLRCRVAVGLQDFYESRR